MERKRILFRSGNAIAMTTERMLEALRQRPFQPFLLRVADGRTVAVSHSEQAALHPQGRTMIVDQPDQSWQLVDLLLVNGIEFRESITS